MTQSPSSAIAHAPRKSRDDGYGKSTRFYETPAGTFPSVTAILGCVGKPALIPWAAKVERELCRDAAANLYMDLAEGRKKMSRAAYLVSLDARIGKQKAHVKELAKASEIGTQVHALIEYNMRKELGQEPGPEPIVAGKATWAFSCYETWRRTAKLTPTLIEQVVWSAEYGYAGTLDAAGWMVHEGVTHHVVLDWKTGKAVYIEAQMQAAAYAHALCEMGHAEPESAGCIVRLPKIESDPDPEVVFIPPARMKVLHDAFLHVVELWRFLDEAKA